MPLRAIRAYIAGHGYGPSLDELAGLSIADVVVPSEYDDSQERLAQLREGQTLPIYELTFRRKDGVEVPAEVNAALCKGCGACAATCPSEAVVLMGFDNRQIYAQIKEALAA